MTTDTLDYRDGVPLDQEVVQRNWKWMLALGIAWVVIGVLAIALPFAATLATNLTLGVLFAIGGILQIVQAFSFRGWRSFGLHFGGGILALVLGALLLFFPLEGIFTLTVFLAAFFFIDGIFKIWAAFQNKTLRHWGWVLASGIIGIGIGALIYLGLPATATWAVGLLVGVELIFSGTAMAMLALSAKDA